MSWTPTPRRPQARSRPLTLAALAVAFACAPALGRAQDSRPTEQPAAQTEADLQARFDALEADLAVAMDSFWESYAAAEEAGEEFDEGEYPTDAFYPRFEALAEAGLPDAMFWVLENMPWDQMDGYAAALERALVADPTNDAIGGVLGFLADRVQGDGRAELAVLDRYMEGAVGDARFSALVAKAEILALDESDDARMAEAIGLLEPLALLAEAYPGQESISGLLFAWKNLRIGMLAPDFETTDVDGNSFKLSDYRGKVTVVEFWGFW